jgi:hypothetical protein
VTVWLAFDDVDQENADRTLSTAILKAVSIEEAGKLAEQRVPSSA